MGWKIVTLIPIDFWDTSKRNITFNTFFFFFLQELNVIIDYVSNEHI